MRDVELLAPVGSFEALKAAVQNGANAVYLGGKDFGARASANNFDRDELKEAVKYAHIRGVQVFVTTNTLRKENEIEDFLEYAKFLYDIDVDAIILQDIGMARLIKRELPDFELHASTQMVAHSLEDVKYLESVGFDRVVLAREVTVEEIKYICDNCKADIEVFVHGALCVCYSGQCLMSSMIGNRSGNRGRCAQPCRQRYELIDVYTGEVVNSNGDYLLSPRDLNAIEEIDKVIDAGVHSLKIEGRMKRPEYVATVIDGYRKTIDEYLATNKLNVSDETINDLYTIFNRKFTKGLLLGDVGKDMMNSQLPNNQGLYVGTVVDYNKKAKRLKIKLANTLKKGDGINLGGGTIGRIIKNGNIEHKIEIKKDLLFDDIVKDINEIGKTINIAVEERLKSERMKNELITNVSHDLKTPLTAIINYISLMKKEDIQPKHLKDYVQVLDKRSQRLKILIEDLFEASKIGSNNIELNLEENDINQLLTQTLVEMEDYINESKLDFIVNTPNKEVYILADGKKTFRVFENIISNILKYSLEKTRVYIDLVESDKKVHISFKNISKHQLNFDPDEITERFTRGDLSRNTEGSGLGLAIAKGLVQAQGGELKVDIIGDLFIVNIDFNM